MCVVGLIHTVHPKRILTSGVSLSVSLVYRHRMSSKQFHADYRKRKGREHRLSTRANKALTDRQIVDLFRRSGLMKGLDAASKYRRGCERARRMRCRGDGYYYNPPSDVELSPLYDAAYLFADLLSALK